jgi:hypothetical protein
MEYCVGLFLKRNPAWIFCAQVLFIVKLLVGVLGPDARKLVVVGQDPESNAT